VSRLWWGRCRGRGRLVLMVAPAHPHTPTHLQTHPARPPRDLKLENIMLSSKAGPAEAKLVDFGLHKVIDERLKRVVVRVRSQGLARQQVGGARPQRACSRMISATALGAHSSCRPLPPPAAPGGWSGWVGGVQGGAAAAAPPGGRAVRRPAPPFPAGRPCAGAAARPQQQPGGAGAGAWCALRLGPARQRGCQPAGVQGQERDRAGGRRARERLQRRCAAAPRRPGLPFGAGRLRRNRLRWCAFGGQSWGACLSAWQAAW
jgi:hypothetical protein